MTRRLQVRYRRVEAVMFATDTPERPGGVFALIVPWDLHHAGGVNRVASDLYAQLEHHGHYRPLVIVASWEQKTPTSGLDPHGRRTVWMRIRTPFYGTKVTPRTLFSYAMLLPSELRRAFRFMRDHGIGVANFHYVGGLSFTWALLHWSRLYRGEIVLSFHGTDLRDLAGERGLARLLTAWMLRRADRLVVCSSEMARQLRTAFHVVPERVQVVHNGIDPAQIRGVLGADPLAARRDDAKLVVSLGSYERVKAHDILLTAFKRLLDDHPDAKLIIAGRTGRELDATRAAVQSAGLAQSVELKVDASHDEALRLLSRARVFVLPSRSEGLPLAVLEAGVIGKAVVATAVGGTPEIIRDRQDGLLVPAEDADALCLALSTLLSDPHRAGKLGQSLQERVLTEFTLTEVMAGYLRGKDGSEAKARVGVVQTGN
jgi:glycosyltransferase involved in cell wall biosynthesis